RTAHGQDRRAVGGAGREIAGKRRAAQLSLVWGLDAAFTESQGARMNNPYRAEPDADIQEKATRSWRGKAASLVRMAVLAVIGYGLYVAALTVSYSSNLIALPPDEWIAGMLAAIAFGAAELVRIGTGKGYGLLRRIGIATAIMVVSAVVTIAIS